MYTASTALLEALHEAGVSYLFANLGSDHSALIETIAEGRANGRDLPQLITCPNEMVALSSAHGFAQVSGQAQAVVVHVECGTQALGGAVHNAARGRVPVFIFAGLSPFTQEGELRGSRNEFLQWIQDVHDQRGIVREYMKYDNEFRTAANVKAIVRRAMLFAHSEPKGPVYLVGAREVMEEECKPTGTPGIAPCGALFAIALPATLVAEIVGALERARRPLIVTSYAGRKPEAVDELLRLAHGLGIGVLESVPNFMNYPHDDELYVGNQWNQAVQNIALAEADVILVVDSDVPWIPTVSQPSPGAVIFHIDVDPLKSSMPLWYIHAQRSCQADATTALAQMNAHVATSTVDLGAVEERRRHYSALHTLRLQRLRAAEQPKMEAITPEYLTACI
ncbi:MAG: thiamine pyrophosphate-binding protein, partial [Steroidobacteraceae bacterium]